MTQKVHVGFEELNKLHGKCWNVSNCNISVILFTCSLKNATIVYLSKIYLQSHLVIYSNPAQ